MPKGVYKHHKLTKEHRIKLSISHKGKVLSYETRQKMSNSKKGKNHWNYKGITKSTVHPWVVSMKGKASEYVCEFCKKRKATAWSNIDHKYKKNINDYRALCWSCHHRWDYKFNNKKREKKKRK